MLPLRRVALQNVRRFHTASLCRFPIPETSSSATRMSSQHTAGNGMNEPGAYTSGPTADSQAASQFNKDNSAGQHAKPDKYATWDSADSDSTVGIQSLNKKAAKAKRTANAKGETLMDQAKATAQNAAEKVKSVVSEGTESNVAGDLKSTLSNVLHKAKETVSNVTSKVSDTASTVSHKLQDTKENMAERATSFGDRMEHKFEGFAERVAASGEALDARDAAPEESDLNVPKDAKPIGQQPNPARKNDVMEGVPGMTRQANEKTEGITKPRHGGQM